MTALDKTSYRDAQRIVTRYERAYAKCGAGAVGERDRLRFLIAAARQTVALMAHACINQELSQYPGRVLWAEWLPKMSVFRVVFSDGTGHAEKRLYNIPLPVPTPNERPRCGWILQSDEFVKSDCYPALPWRQAYARFMADRLQGKGE